MGRVVLSDEEEECDEDLLEADDDETWLAAGARRTTPGSHVRSLKREIEELLRAQHQSELSSFNLSLSLLRNG